MSDNNRDTLVVTGMGSSIPRQIGELAVARWHSGDALADKEKLEEFIRQVSYGNIGDPQTAAADLMDEMMWA
jgi:hypothetical protein